MDPAKIDGNATLSEQEDTLNTTENIGAVKTISYEIADPAASHKNLATFEDVPQTEIPPPIRLVPVPNGQPNVPQGKELVFVSDIWVSGVVRKVAGIR